MRFEVSRLDFQHNSLEVNLHHKGRTIQWTYAVNDRSKANSRRVPDDMLFYEINDYWATLPDMTQDTLFRVYDDIRTIFYNSLPIKELCLQLTPLLAELYTLIDFNNLLKWTHQTNCIDVPPNVEVEYSSGAEENKSRELTYIREDYWNLMTLAIALRAVVPIWGNFIDYTKKQTGQNWKERQPYLLLSKSPLWECEPMERLRRYVQTRVESVTGRSDSDKLDSMVLDSVGTEELPEWLMALIIVRKVCVAEIRFAPNQPIVSPLSIIYHQVNEKLNHSAANFLGYVKDKIPDVGGADSDGRGSKNSLLEAYKIQTLITSGQKATLDYVGKNFSMLAQQLAPDVPKQVLRQVIENVKVLQSHRVHLGQRAIVQNVTANSNPPAGAQFISHEAILAETAITQAILWHRGHKEIAALLTAIPAPFTGSANLIDSVTRARFSKEMQEALAALYPFNRVKVGRDSKKSKQTNDGVNGIEEIIRELDRHVWRLTIPPSWQAILLGPDVQVYQYSVVPTDIRNKLAALALDLDVWAKEFDQRSLLLPQL